MCQPKRRRAPSRSEARSLSPRCAWPPTWAWAFRSSMGCRRTLIASRLADRLGVDRATASQTYYACLLSHAGCTTDAHVTPEVFGGSLTTHLQPRHVRVGTRGRRGASPCAARARQVGPVRAFQVARGLPRMAREQRPHLTASCEVAGMLAVEIGAPPSVPGLLGYLTERWDGWGPLRRAKGEEIPLADADRARRRRRRLPASAGWRGARRAPRPRARGARVRSRGRGLPGRRCRGDPRARRARVGLGRDARSRAGPTAHARRARGSIARSPRWATSPT